MHVHKVLAVIAASNMKVNIKVKDVNFTIKHCCHVVCQFHSVHKGAFINLKLLISDGFHHSLYLSCNLPVNDCLL